MSHKIAVVEDEASIQLMYKLKLERAGFDVITASNGIEGLEVIRSHQPELILLDLRMPNMSGEEMLAKLRSNYEDYVPRVVVLTNISKSEAPAALRLLHVDRYIVKAHHTPSQVVDIVNEILGIKPVST